MSAVDPRGETAVLRLSRIEAIAARRLAEAKATIPEIVLRLVVDMRAAVALHERLGEADGVTPSYNDMVVRASALALRDHPRANASWADGEIVTYGRVNVGVAVANEADLVVPTVFDADRRSLADVARETRRLTAAVRSGTVSLDELSGATFTVSNLGMLGVESFSAIINPPQVAILAVGAIGRHGDGTRPLVLSLTCDHRVLSGAPAAAFLAQVGRLLAEPEALVPPAPQQAAGAS